MKSGGRAHAEIFRIELKTDVDDLAAGYRRDHFRRPPPRAPPPPPPAAWARAAPPPPPPPPPPRRIEACATAAIALILDGAVAGLPCVSAGVAGIAERFIARRPVAQRLITRGPVADIAIAACACASAAAQIGAVAGAARLQHLLTARATEVQLIAAAGIVAAEFGRDARVVVTDVAAVRRIVRPVIAVDVVDVGRAVDVDVSAAPIEAAAPAIAARRPTAERIAGAERQPGRQNCDADIGRRRPVIGRIVRIRPVTIDHGGIVIRHVELVRIGRRDVDVLLAARALRGHRLLAGRLQLVVGLRLHTQALDRIHDVGLLRQHRVAELLRPVELVAHHVEHVGRGRERFYAVVPVLLVDRRLERVALESLVGIGPAVGLDDFERIGRGHEDFREQRVGIERDRSDQRIELASGQQLLRRRRSRL